MDSLFVFGGREGRRSRDSASCVVGVALRSGVGGDRVVVVRVIIANVEIVDQPRTAHILRRDKTAQ